MNLPAPLMRTRMLLRQTWDLWTSGGSSTSLLAWDAAKGGDRLKRWYPPSTDFAAILGPQLLKSRSRDADRNNCWAHRAVNLLRDYVIGVGIKPMIDLADPTLRARVHSLWTSVDRLRATSPDAAISTASKPKPSAPRWSTAKC